MEITFTPVRMDAALELSAAGDTLTINGESFDFSGVTEGATLPRDAVATDWLASDVERVGGVLKLTIIAPYEFSGVATMPVTTIMASDGSIDIPAITAVA